MLNLSVRSRRTPHAPPPRRCTTNNGAPDHVRDTARNVKAVRTYTRAYLHTIVTRETTACHLLSVHNIAYQMRLMGQIRAAVMEDRYVDAA